MPEPCRSRLTIQELASLKHPRRCTFRLEQGSWYGFTVGRSRRTGELPSDYVRLRTTIVGCADPDLLPGGCSPGPATCIYVPFA
ncbi:uncharacterized protein LOC119188892 isoform X3 [Manduca sexta]|uniref:uncharacterized protein LOC119188892 isoform X3 n=1 Tax=Manduca sexta TaxID=7130 RepID=UPI00188F15AF|nr:uncharacterized protein LOC119188892 isoform X3 [Manduca sexta]